MATGAERKDETGERARVAIFGFWDFKRTSGVGDADLAVTVARAHAANGQLSEPCNGAAALGECRCHWGKRCRVAPCCAARGGAVCDSHEDDCETEHREGDVK